MGFSGFIKLPKHRIFNYQPRFYDERKELLENKSKENDAKKIITDDRSKISNYYITRAKYSKKQSLLRRIIIVVTMLLLVAVVYMALEFYSKIT
jgi:hypothetical protein